jgi:hypothetical protein
MDLLHLPSECILRLTVEKDGESVYDIGVAIDQMLLNKHREDVLDSAFRLIGRRLASDWKDKLF